MRLPLPSLLALCCVSALAAPTPKPSPTTPAESPAARLPLQVGSVSCKPSAPLRLDLTAPDDGAGSFEVRYSVTPLLDVLDLEVELRLPDGGAVASHAAVREGRTESGRTHAGTAVVSAPDGPGFVLEVVARARVVDPVMEGGIATLSVTRLLEYGDVERAPLGDRLVTASPDGGEVTVSRDFPAIYRPASGAGEAR